MEWIVFPGAFIGIYLFVICKGRADYQRKAEKLRKTFQKEYGNANKREWKDGQLKSISYYSQKRKTKYAIDELTWNDLDMNEVYRQMAYTNSSLGDDYLYYMLRNPIKEERVLKERERKISCLQKQEESRLKMQVLFAQIGRIREYSFSQYVEYLMQQKPGNNIKHYLTDILILFSLILMKFHLGVGGSVFFTLILYNIVTYFKDKAYLEPYLASIRYLFKNLDYAKELIGILPKEWEEEKQRLQKILILMKKIRKNSFLVMSPGRMGGEGLELLLDYVRMCLHPDIIKFNKMLLQLQQYEKEIWELYEIMGKADAYTAISCYRASLPKAICPTFHKEKNIVMEDVYHPLIENAVSNSLELQKNILLTGSNASGKSTFLKTIGINILLAQTIHTCMAERFEMPFCSLYTSMSLKDNLSLKESYYMAEIRAIKRILDAAEEEETIICMVDEVLRGTNTVERIAASTQILKGMALKGIICLAATHDVELTKTLEQYYDNYHFEEGIIKGDIVFSYELKKGKAESCNAINLLSYMGYESVLISEAREMVNYFEKQGEWICR